MWILIDMKVFQTMNQWNLFINSLVKINFKKKEKKKDSLGL